MRIGDLARQTGLSTQTLRYYERRGIIVPTGRTASGYREYSPDAVTIVRFVQWLKALGFTLREVREYCSVLIQRDRRAPTLRSGVAAKAAEIERKIRELTLIRYKLQEIAECVCRSGECPLIAQVIGKPSLAQNANREEYSALPPRQRSQKP